MAIDNIPLDSDRRRRSRFLRRSFYVILLVGCFLAVLAASNRGKPPAGSGLAEWKEYPGNPVIKMGDAIPHMLWNDPSVLKEGGTYRMWLSGGDPSDLKHIVVQVYLATSKDGVNWDIDPKPVLTPSSDPKAFDSLRTETPSVIKAGDTYHLYYTGFDERGAKEGFSEIGHATSKDGIHWTKDPANPVVVGQTEDKTRWGYNGVGEPGAVYNPKDKTIYLYYVGMHFPPERKNIGTIGVLLATSKDGSKFTHHADKGGNREVLFTRDVPNAIKGSWFGYSTPAAIITKDGKFRLFVDFLVAPGGPGTARQVTLVQGVSNNGIDFDTAEEKIFEAGKGDWKDLQVRSPTVVEEPDGTLKMWFAGETRKPHFGAGIGMATREKP